MREGFSEWQRGAEGDTLTRVVRAGRTRMGECCKSWGLRRMPDVPLKITKYVIFVLTQIASSAGFLSGQVVSSTKSLKTRMGGWTEEQMENIPDTEVPAAPAIWDKATIVKFSGKRLHFPLRRMPSREQEAGQGGLRWIHSTGGLLPEVREVCAHLGNRQGLRWKWGARLVPRHGDGCRMAGKNLLECGGEDEKRLWWGRRSRGRGVEEKRFQEKPC